MRILLLFLVALLMVGCQAEQSKTGVNQSAEVETLEDEDTVYTEEDLEAAIEEAYQEGYDEGYQVGNEEGYEEGYSNGSDEGYENAYSDAEESASYSSLPSGNNFSSSSELKLFSDGMDWNLAMDLEKKEFIRAAMDAYGQIVTYSELDDYIMAIDIYYENNLRSNTLQDALESLR